MNAAPQSVNAPAVPVNKPWQIRNGLYVHPGGTGLCTHCKKRTGSICPHCGEWSCTMTIGCMGTHALACKAAAR